MIYLDYAATAPLRKEALDAMLPWMQECGNPDSLHAAGRRAAVALQDARDEVAAALGVKPSEVYFTSGGTEADNWAVRMPKAAERGVLLSEIEHHAVLEAARASRNKVTLLPVGKDGIVSPRTLERTLKDEGLVGVMAVNNETGCIQPVLELSEIAHARGALFFSDCVQAACACDLRPIAAACDLMSVSSHKVGGPVGVGALVVKKGVRISPLIYGGEQERGLRGGTSNVAGAVGFARALTLATQERERFIRHTGALRDLFEQEIKKLLEDKVRVDGGARVPNISHLTFAWGGGALLGLVDRGGVACSAGAACAAHSAQPSHVMVAMGRTEKEALAGLRFSFGQRTSEQDAVTAAKIVAERYFALTGGIQ